MNSRAAAVLGIWVAIFAALSCMERGPLRFPHGVHLGEQRCGGPGEPQCLTCITCHAIGRDNPAFSPAQVSLCGSCHKDSKATASTPVRDPASSFSRSVHFSHVRHLELPELSGQCVPCHAGVAVGRDRAPSFPPMQKCFECHEHQQQWAEGECSPCHERADIQGVLPESFLRHDAAFGRRHGVFARAEEKTCSQCHSASQCDDCHNVSVGLSVERREPEALERSFAHRGDFITRHGLEASSNSAKCLRCHTTQSCDGCHLERGVSGNRKDAANPHPPGFVRGFPGDPNAHSRQARRDIAACAVCHDQGPATNCIACHRVGAYGGNPHPNGWRSARSENSEMCRYCHGG